MRLVVASSRRYNGDLTTSASLIDNCPPRHRDVGDSTSTARRRHAAARRAREEHRHRDATFYTHLFTRHLFHTHARLATHITPNVT